MRGSPKARALTAISPVPYIKSRIAKEGSRSPQGVVRPSRRSLSIERSGPPAWPYKAHGSRPFATVQCKRSFFSVMGLDVVSPDVVSPMDDLHEPLCPIEAAVYMEQDTIADARGAQDVHTFSHVHPFPAVWSAVYRQYCGRRLVVIDGARHRLDVGGVGDSRVARAPGLYGGECPALCRCDINGMELEDAPGRAACASRYGHDASGPVVRMRCGITVSMQTGVPRRSSP
jgi:hypothetical protein